MLTNKNIIDQLMPCWCRDQRSHGWRSAESGKDDPLREQRYEQGTAYTNRSIYLALLRALIQAYRTSGQVFIRR